jgi:hypothetical protein
MITTPHMTSRSGIALVLGMLAMACSQRDGAPVAGETNPRHEGEGGASEPADAADTPLADGSAEQAFSGTTDAAADAASVDAGVDAAAMDAGAEAQCSALRLLTLSEPTVARSMEAMHEPWPQDDRLTLQYSGQPFKVGIRLTNASTADMSTVGVWLSCSSEARVHNGGAVWFESIAPNATMVASVTVQREPGELICSWHKVMGPDWRAEGCVVEERDVRLTLVLE